jgi:hypothetical protein
LIVEASATSDAFAMRELAEAQLTVIQPWGGQPPGAPRGVGEPRGRTQHEIEASTPAVLLVRGHRYQHGEWRCP